MYQRRAKIGLLVLATNTTMEPEFYRMAPEGVSIHTARMFMAKETLTPKVLAALSKKAVKAAKEVSQANVDVVVFGCTGGSFIKGVDYNLHLTKMVEEAVNIPTITASTAVINALRKLGVKKVSVATPYPDFLNRKVVEFLEQNRLTVTDIKGLQITELRDLGRKPPEVAYKLVKKLNLDNADAVLISCTDFRTIEIISKLENDTGKPVVTSNQATMWEALNKVGMKEKIENYGRLLYMA